MNPLATIGYETDTQSGMIDRLKAADVELVIDVRAVASSRKAGFSKTLLAGGLKDQGVDYLHLRDLGTPKPGRDAARTGRIDEMRQIFEAQLEEPAAVLALAQATALAKTKRIALLCYEDDPNCCHRRIVADRIRERLKCEVVDL
ncbi:MULTISPECIES: DUF488 family protein [unclassified Caulobacter]|uniref:DUF488 domain-containing protein n=1 Tax=unclassified Caulobacter TaxID=2648921 RepID=UPI0007807D9D|nr:MULTISPECIES: DUF488 domain-containing protein [unclassified Caulobacter]AZS23552.1 DUF488 domain-containing protein [Caulobacter sp. FWC26]